MHIIGASIVRGASQPGLEVEFRGEGGESVSIHLKGDDVSRLSDAEVIARAKEMLIEVVTSDQAGRPT